MFDVGFWELVVLFGLGLIILGPERLPQVAMKVGNWAGQARRMARHLSSQIRDEINDIDINDPFSSTGTGQATPHYNRPGVDDLDPSAPAADSTTSEAPDAPSMHGDDTPPGKAG